MAIYRLIKNASFDPAKISVMVEAYECACRALDLLGEKNDRLTEMVAKKIVEIAHTQSGLDAKVICTRSLEELGITKH